MRTKALFVAAMAGIAALTTSVAQVYSVNVVGYINIPLVDGFNLVANQLDNGNGNLIVDVIGDQATEGSIVYKFKADGTYAILTYEFGAWDGTAADLAETMAPGEGVFIRSIGAATVTVVGEVVEGAQDVALPQGFSIFSSVAPVVTDLSAAAVTFPAEDGDFYYTWDQALNAGAGGYNILSYDFGVWDPNALVLEVGQAAWARKATTQTWTRDFSVPRS